MVLVLAPDSGRTRIATVTLDAPGAASSDFDLDWSLPAVDEIVTAMTEMPPRAFAPIPVDDAPAVTRVSFPSLTHVGPLSTTIQPSAATVFDLVVRLRPGAAITFDPEARPSVVDDVAYTIEQSEAFVAVSDVVKASDEDLLWLYPERTVEETASAWLALGPAIVVITRGL